MEPGSPLRGFRFHVDYDYDYDVGYIQILRSIDELSQILRDVFGGPLTVESG